MRYAEENTGGDASPRLYLSTKLNTLVVEARQEDEFGSWSLYQKAGNDAEIRHGKYEQIAQLWRCRKGGGDVIVKDRVSQQCGAKL